tara:strand:+ start:13932 stop:14834 length:903 start_codon:yes stop_codon:yes gene_type:complete
MAIRQINVTDSLETLRSQFNALASQDFGDIANLDSSITATNIVGAMNEVINIVGASEGFFIVDESSTRQLIGAGQELQIKGTANETTVAVQATDTLVIGLPSDVTVSNGLTVGSGGISSSGNIATTGSAAVKTNTIDDVSGGVININSAIITSGDATLGSINISGNTITSNNSNTITVNDNLTISAGLTFTTPTITAASGNLAVSSDITMAPGKLVIFEGATDDGFETAITVTDPTADRVITFPDAGGTVLLTGTTGSITGAMISDDTITGNKLKSTVTLVLYNSSGVAQKTIYGAGALS